MNAERVNVLILSGLVALGGCATPGETSPGGGSADVESICNPLVSGLIGAAACGLIVRGNDRVRAAAACAAVAVIGCYILNSYKAEQVRTAKQVQDDYVKSHQRLPASATLVSYRSQLNPKATVTRGEKISARSKIVVVPGQADKDLRVEEEIRIVDAKGEKWGADTRKPANQGGQGGEYHTSFTIPVADGMQQGQYTVQKSLYVNGKSASSQNSRFQVVQSESGPVVAWIQ